MVLEVVETVDRDEWNEDDFTDVGLRATLMHHTENDGERNKYAVMMGETVIVVQLKE